jgi:hypothetical protein
MPARDELDQLRKQKRLRELEARIPNAQTKPEGGAFRRFGQGMADRLTINANKLANLELLPAQALGYKIPQESSFSKEGIAQQEANAAPVANTTAGAVGGLAGDAIMTAPLGIVGRGMQAAEGTPYIGRILGSRPAQAAVEGGLAGAMTADPGERGEDIRRGMMTGAVLERVGRLGMRTLEGLVRRSPEAQMLDNVADLHGTKVQLPLANAASEEGIISPFAKFLYGKVLPALPGTSGPLQRQSQRAAAQLREIAMKEASPGGMGSIASGYSGGLPMTTGKQVGAGGNVRVSMKDIQDAFAREYNDTIGSYVFNRPDAQDLATQLQKIPNIDDPTLASVLSDFDSLATRYTKNGVLEGGNVLRLKNDLARRAEGADEVAGAAYEQAQQFVDDFVGNELRQGNNMQNVVDLQRYMDLAKPWQNFQRVQRAAARSSNPDGEFTPQELMRSVKVMADDKQLARGTAPMQELAAIGEKTTAPIHQPSFLEKGMVYGGLGGLGVIGSPLATAGLIAGARTAASPAIQDVLMGTTNAQQALVKALRKRPTATRLTGAGVRNTMAAEVADDEQE